MPYFVVRVGNDFSTRWKNRRVQRAVVQRHRKRFSLDCTFRWTMHGTNLIWRRNPRGEDRPRRDLRHKLRVYYPRWPRWPRSSNPLNLRRLLKGTIKVTQTPAIFSCSLQMWVRRTPVGISQRRAFFVDASFERFPGLARKYATSLAFLSPCVLEIWEFFASRPLQFRKCQLT